MTPPGNTPYPDRPRATAAGKRPIPRFLGNAWRMSVLVVVWPLVSAIVWLHDHVRLPSWVGGSPREFLLRLWGLIWLIAVWVLLWGDPTWGNVAAGTLVGILVLTLLPLPKVPVEGRLHVLASLNLVVRLVRDFFLSSAQVAWAAIKPWGPPPLGAVVRVHVAIKSDLVLTLAIDYINLVPGTMVVDIDHLRRVLYIHVFDVRKQRQIDSFFSHMEYIERQFIWAFERDREWHPSPFHGIDDDYHHVPYADRKRVRDQREAAGGSTMRRLLRGGRGRGEDDQ